jgi:hypothetical protein
MKKETFEEVAKRYYPPYPDGIITDEIRALREGFVKGCEVQSEKIDADMKEAIRFGFDKGFCSNSSNKNKNLGLSEKEWFEQYKKK